MKHFNIEMIIYTKDEAGREQLKKLYERDSLWSAPLEAICVDDAVILPDRDRKGGVIDRSGAFVTESAYQHGDVNLWGGSYEIVEQEIEYVPEKVIFIGQLFRHWGNFLFDCLARVWCALKEEEELRIAYCFSLQSPNDAFEQKCKNFFQLLGISQDRLLEIRKPVRFHMVIVPQLSIFPGTFCTKEFLEVFDEAVSRVANSMNGEVYDRLYLTRTQMASCKELGEKKIEHIFRKLGFQIIAPEKLKIEEQIYLFSHCKILASIEGTTSHNIMFAGERTEHIILRKQRYVNTRQVLFDRVKKIEPQYIDIFFEPFQGFPLNHDAGPFWVGITSSMKKWMKSQGITLSWKEWGAILMSEIMDGILYTAKCLYYKYVLKY